ncbi:MAG: hypothetical protein M1822_009633 [Bathelium mastoideum]|nr:MAG: hypothetical protein M1822_009633 [Bathelium mastoideum]
MSYNRIHGNAESPSTAFNDDRREHDDQAWDLSVSSKDVPMRSQISDVKPSTTITGETERNIRGPRWVVLVLGLVFANLLTSMDNTITADVQAPIIVALGDVRKFPWISVGYGLGAASVQLFWGQLYRLFDNKILLLSAITIFEVGSVVCGSATSLNAFIVGRVVCGLGGTGCFTGIMNIISRLTTRAERALYVSFPGAAWAIGAIIGPIIGGGISSSGAGWRWCFYINVVAGGAWIPVYIFLLPKVSPMPGIPVLTRLRKLDVAGAVLFAGALCSGTIAISFGGSLFAWRSGRIIGALVASGILWILFGMQQGLGVLCDKNYRLFPVHLLRSWEMWILYIQQASSISVLFLSIYFVPIYFQFIHGNSTIKAGVRLLPLICFTIFFLLMSGSIMGKTGLYMPWYLGGSALIIVGAALMHTIDIGTGTANILGYTIIVGAGVGSFCQASFAVAQAKVLPSEIPIAVAFIGSAQITSICICFAVAYSIYLNTTVHEISHILPNATLFEIQESVIGVDSSVLSRLDKAQMIQVLEAVNRSIRNVWIQILTAGALSFILAMFMKRERVLIKK